MLWTASRLEKKRLSDQLLAQGKPFLKSVVLRIAEPQLVAFLYIDRTRIGIHQFARFQQDPLQKHVDVFDLGVFDSEIDELG